VAVPYLLAGLGGTFSEKGGVVNLGLEGMLLFGAFAYVVGAYTGGSAWVGVLFSAAAGLLLAALHALICVGWGGNQVVSGVAVNLLAAGLTRFMLRVLFGSSSNSPRVTSLQPLIQNDHPLASLTHPVLAAALAAVVVAHFVLRRTRFGLRLRSVGENPAAADAMGLRLKALQSAGVLISGALAGLGGAWLAMDQSQFTEGMSAGRGFIALAAIIFGRWNPWGVLAACLLFGSAEVAQMRLQAVIHLPPQLLQSFPYVLTLVALAGFTGRCAPPAGLGRPYQRG
jgi:simple sugar transport system permease protein